MTIFLSLQAVKQRLDFDSLQRLEKILGYHFKNPDLLHQAVSHRSVGNIHYERLEFLGDSILGFIIADELYQRFPVASEGQMTRLRSQLVKGKTLAELAIKLSLGDFLQLGSGELKSGGFRRESILADSFEAIIGGIYLESGIETCRDRLIDWYGEYLAKADPADITKDPKTLLQEHMQSFNLPLPVYEILLITGKDHDQQFEVECVCTGNSKYRSNRTVGIGKSRRQAEQIAASKLLELLKD
jgi:ribonuclease-3